MIFVVELCAWTNAPRNGVPSGAVTVPVTVAPKANEPGSNPSTRAPAYLEAVLIAPPWRFDRGRAIGTKPALFRKRTASTPASQSAVRTSAGDYIEATYTRS